MTEDRGSFEDDRTRAQPEGWAADAAAEISSSVGRSVRERIGPFRILELLGEGGMGAVYLAEQERPRRRVALKVLRAGVATPSILARFEHEAETLGRLQHEGIAQIFQAGTATADGVSQPYFVMEYIEGRDLTTYARDQELDLQSRLKLLSRICDAVQHAHQKGVVHRDLKPANILVTADGGAKILDFGVARVVDADSATTTGLTRAGHVVGTVHYMSPEQAAGDSARVDARSDVYSLGVIAHELLGGSHPFDLEGKLVHEALRTVVEDEPPRLGQRDRSLAGDVETIVGKALEKDADRRYPSASALAADIRRYLNHEPISARPASTVYQLRKFARRHRALAASLAAVALSLVTATGISLVAAEHALQARAQAERERDRAEAGRRLALGEQWLEISPSVALAFGLSALELADSDEARGFALRALWRGPVGFQLLPYDWEAWSLRFSKDGRYLGAAGDLSAFWTDDGESHQFDLGEPTGRVAIASDSSTLASVGWRTGTVRRWALPATASPEEHSLSATPEVLVDLSPDGELVISARTAGETTLVELVRGERRQRRHFPLPLARLGWAPVTAGRESPYCVDAANRWFAWAEGNEVLVVPIEDFASSPAQSVGAHDDLVFDLALSSDGRRLASYDLGGGINVWDLAGPGPPRGLRGPGSPGSVNLNTDGSLLAVTVLTEKHTLVWDLEGPLEAEPVVARFSQGQVNGAAFDPSGEWLAVATAGGTLASPWRARRPHVLAGGAEAVAFSSTGREIVTFDGSRMRLQRSSLGPDALPSLRWSQAAEASGRSGGATGAFALTADGSWSVVASVPGTVHLVSLTGADSRVVGRLAGGARTLALSRDDGLVAVGGSSTPGDLNDAEIRVWDLASGEVVQVLKPEARWSLRDLEFLPDGRLISASGGGLLLWDLDSGSSTRLAEAAERLAVFPDGERLLVVLEGEPWVLGLDGSLVKRLDAHVSAARLSAIAIDPSGRWIASGDRAGAIRIGPLEGDSAHLLLGHESRVFHLAFDSKGERLASSNPEGSVRIWPVPVGKPLQDLPRPELVSRLRSLTNVRISVDPSVEGGLDFGFDSFPGWRTRPVW